MQRLFLASCAAEGHKVCGANVEDACAHSPAAGVKTHMTVDEACSEWFKETQGKDIKKGQVMEVLHSLQGHPIRQAMDANDR